MSLGYKICRTYPGRSPAGEEVPAVGFLVYAVVQVVLLPFRALAIIIRALK
jgi:hypothetical protein